MDGLPNRLIEEIKVKLNLSEEEINSKIAQKQKDLHGLLSREGALHILANEVGIQAKDYFTKSVPVGKLLVGMRGFEVEGIVTKVFPIHKFERNGKQGSVGSFNIKDTTGMIRVVLWDDKTSLLSNLHESDSVMVQNARIQQKQDGLIELHVNSTTRIVLTPAAPIPRKPLSVINETDNALYVYGTIVSIYDLRYFEQCPQCRKRLMSQDQQWLCQIHGPQQPNYGYLLSIMIDDGTATQRVLLFSRQVEQLLGITSKEILSMRENHEHMLELKKQLLGKNIMSKCSVHNNTMFSRIELHAAEIFSPTAEQVLSHMDNLVIPSSE